MRGALESIAGVEQVDVDFETKRATVQCSGTPDTEAMLEALQETGFGGSVEGP